MAPDRERMMECIFCWIFKIIFLAFFAPLILVSPEPWKLKLDDIKYIWKDNC